MTLRIKLSHLVVGLVACSLLIGAGYALATTRSVVIHACVNSRTRALTVPASGRCARGSRALNWNERGPRGARGTRGARGVKGLTGANGAAGSTATISVGSVTTEAPGSQATVTNSGSGSNAILNFGIPQGAAGAAATGIAATAYGQVWMGSGTNSVTLARGSGNVTVGGGAGDATVFVSGCSTAGLAEPVILVSADHDPAHTTGGGNTATTAGAYVTGWSDSDSVLGFDVSTYNAIDGSGAMSDFSFVVYC